MSWDRRRGLKIAAIFFLFYLALEGVLALIPIEGIQIANEGKSLLYAFIRASLGSLVFGFVFGLRVENR